MNIKSIKNEKDYREALDLIYQLMDIPEGHPLENKLLKLYGAG